MSTYVRLTYDVEHQLERARQLRGKYIRRLLHRASNAVSDAVGRALKFAVHPHRSAAH